MAIGLKSVARIGFEKKLAEMVNVGRAGANYPVNSNGIVTAEIGGCLKSAPVNELIRKAGELGYDAHTVNGRLYIVKK